MFFRPIYIQYLLEVFVFSSLIYFLLLARMKKSEPRRVLLIFVALNILRFGGCAAAFAAMQTSSSPSFLLFVAIGDGLSATLALIAFGLLWKKSKSALAAVMLMNVIGLADIVTSEIWLSVLEQRGSVVRASLIHGPSIGAALYTSMHIYIFYFILQTRTVRVRA